MALESVALEIPPQFANAASAGKTLTREEYEALRAVWANKNLGVLVDNDCSLCKNRGYTVEMRCGNLIYHKCVCEIKRINARRLEKSGLADVVKEQTFRSYQTPEEWQKTAKKQAVEYLRNPDGRWFVAAGSVGSGKTHLCTAICGAMMEAGRDVRYMPWVDDGGRLKAAVNDTDEYTRLINPLKAVEVLYIDDFWKTEEGKTPTTGDIKLAFEILNARYINRRLITIISSEMSITRMLDIDEAVGSRIYEKSKRGSLLNIEGDNKNWRLRV